MQTANRPSGTGGQGQNSSEPQQGHYVTRRRRLSTGPAAAGPPPGAAEPAPASASRVRRGPPGGVRPGRALPLGRTTPPTPGATGRGAARCFRAPAPRATPHSPWSRPRDARCRPAPPPPLSQLDHRCRSRTMPPARLAPPPPIAARVIYLNLGGGPIERFLLARTPPSRHRLPNGCLFLHTALGGGTSNPNIDALSASLLPRSLMNRRTNQWERRKTNENIAGRTRGGSLGTTAGLANGPV